MEMKKFTRLSMLLSLSVVLSILESLLPILNGITIPGVKLGLANIVILVILYTYSFKDALFVSILRVFLVSILRTGLFSLSFYFSLVGSFFALIGMKLFQKYSKLSMIGVSIVGSMMHSVGQIVVASIFLHNALVFHYLPWILLFSIPTGIFTGIISKQLYIALQKIL